jgi:hypothetical protein
MRYQIIYEDDVIEKNFAKLDGFNRQLRQSVSKRCIYPPPSGGGAYCPP